MRKDGGLMGLEQVKAYFESLGMAERVREFPVSSATVELAAQALGCQPQRIAKTLSFQAGEQTVLIVAAGDCRIDNSLFKAVFHTKAKMLSAAQVEERTGHPVGGVCPFAVKEGVQIFLDESLKRFDTVYPACGSPNSAIELTIQELEQCCPGSSWVRVCKQLEAI